MLAVHDRHPVGLEGGTRVGGEGLLEGGGVVGLADERHGDQGVEPGVGEVADDGDVLDTAPVHLFDLPEEEREQLGVGEDHAELVNGDAVVALEDVDAHDVAPHGADAGGDGTEGSGPVMQPDAQEHAGCSWRSTGCTHRADGPPATFLLRHRTVNNRFQYFRVASPGPRGPQVRGAWPEAAAGYPRS